MFRLALSFIASAVFSFYLTLLVAGFITGFYMNEVW